MGRPKGIYGNPLLRKTIAEEQKAAASSRNQRPRGRPRKLLLDNDDSDNDNDDINSDDEGDVDTSFHPSHLQRLVLNQAVQQAKKKVAAIEDETKNPARHILMENREIKSERVARNLFTNEDIRQVASTLVESTNIFWSNLCNRIVALLQPGSSWRGLMFGVARRYDETPLSLRIAETEPAMDSRKSSENLDSVALLPCQDPSAQADFSQRFASASNRTTEIGRTKTTCKVMQSELYAHALLCHEPSGQFLRVGGKIPVPLQCLETTKALQIAQSQLNVLGALPNFGEMTRHFDMCHFVTCTDRYSGNFAAEKHLKAKYPGFGSTHISCHIHELSSCEKVLSDLTAGHIGGMVSLGLAMKNAGSLQELRQILYNILAKELQTFVGPPVKQDHREHIYNCFLPLDPIHTVVGKEQETADASGGNLQHQLRRAILKHFLNGNIHDESCVQHFAWSSVDRQELLAQMKIHLVPALLPNRCQVLNRSKWLGAEATFSWIGILLLHHGLLSKMMLAWKGRAHPIPISPENISDGPAPGPPGIGPLWQGWGNVASTYFSAPGPTTSDLEARPLIAGPCGENPKDDDDDAISLAGSGSDNEFLAPLCYDPVTGDIDWHESNKANIGKAVAWTQSSPAVAVIIIGAVWQPLLRLMHANIFLGSESFERQEAKKEAEGALRSYPVLELFLGNSMQQYWRSMNHLFHTPIEALPEEAWVDHNLSLMFRMLSRSACAAHQIFDVKHKQVPYLLFGALYGMVSDLEALPKCMMDELTSWFCNHYPGSLVRKDLIFSV